MMVSTVTEVLARNTERLERLLQSPDVVRARARRMKRRGKSIAKRIWRMTVAVLAILIGGLVWGLAVAPLGLGGLALVVALALMAMMLLARYPRDRDPTAEALPQSNLAALPAQVEDWLDSQRPALPAPAARELDQIMIQIDQLTPDLKVLQPTDHRADEAHRLLSDHLPRLVRSYTEVPSRLQRDPQVERQFTQGLKTVRDEIDRLSRDLARERLTALEVEGRFLQTRYNEPGKPGGSQGKLPPA